MFHWNYNSVLTKTTWEDTAMESAVCLLINSKLCSICDLQILLNWNFKLQYLPVEV